MIREKFQTHAQLFPPLYQLVESDFTTRPALQRPDRITARHFWELQKPLPTDIQSVIPGFKKMRAEELQRYIPDPNWFKEQPHAESVHGIPHKSRVGLYTHIIAQAENLSQRDSRLLLAAALAHDTQRVDDRLDPEHGARAAGWIGKKFEENPHFLADRDIRLTTEDIHIVQALCQYHETPYESIPQAGRNQYGNLLQLFMAADALDRYRLPSQEWWPNSDYFSHTPRVQELFERLMPFAEYFTLKNELDRTSMKIPNAHISLLSTGREVGLVETMSDRIFRHLGALSTRRSVPFSGS